MTLLRTPTTLTPSALVTAALLVLLTGCSTAGPGGNTPTTATAAAPGVGSSLASAELPPAAPSLPPTGELSGPPLSLTRGSAHVTMTGGASEAFDLTLSSGTLIPGTNVILVWSGSPDDDSSDDSLRIQAPSRTGVYQSAGDDFSAPAITVSTARIGTPGVPPQFAPVGDECTVTLTKVDATGVEGSLDCRGLTSTGYDQPVDAAASFTATP